MYANIDAKFLEKTRKQASEEAVAELGDDTTDRLLYDEMADKMEIDQIDDDSLFITIENKLGVFSIDLPLTPENLEVILGIALKRMNKIKSLLENLK